MYGQLCTEFYDADKKFATEEELNFYKSIFNIDHRILEPMCGSGRLLIPLLQAGYVVDGVDNSESMLKNCRERALKVGITPRLFEASIEDAHFNQDYDGIIVPLGSFQLVYSRESAFTVLKKFKQALKPGGKLVMDLFVPWDALWENNEEEKSCREVKIDDNTTIKIESNNKANKLEQFIEGYSIYTKWVKGKCVMEEKENMYLNWYYVFEIAFILEKYGFKNIARTDRLLNNENIMTFVAEVAGDE